MRTHALFSFLVCPGNGGKALALAADVGPNGRVVCWDVNTARLTQLATRASRAGAKDVIECADSVHAVVAAGPYDVVLVDAPCSSTGVIRRRVGLRAGQQEF